MSHNASSNEFGKLKFVTQSPQNRRPQPSACYFCRFKKIKCSYERPHCQKCKASELPFEYPRGKRGKRRASIVSRGSEKDSSHSGQEEEGNSPPTGTTTATGGPEQNLNAAHAAASSSPSSSSSPPLPVSSYPSVRHIDNHHQHQCHPVKGAAVGGQQQQQPPDGLVAPQDLVMGPADLVAVADVANHAPDPGFYFPAIFDDESCDDWMMEEKRASMSLEPSAWMGFPTTMGPMPPIPSVVPDVLTQPGTTGMSPIMVETPQSMAAVPPADFQTLGGSKLINSASSPALSELGSSYECKCDTVVVELLEGVTSSRQIGTLLETMTAVRNLLRRFNDIVMCPRCLHQASSTMMRVILAEKLMAQFSDLLLSNKPLTGYAPVQAGFANLAFGDYPVETGEERGEVFAGLLRHNVRLFISVLKQLSDRAQMKEWQHHVATLSVLIAQASSLIGTTRSDMKR